MRTPRDEWRELGAGIRRAVQRNARHSQAHPDLRVAAVAQQYAGDALDRWSGRWARALWFAALALLFLYGAAVGYSRARAGRGAVLAVVLLLLLAISVLPVLRARSLARMELANRLALAPAAMASGPQARARRVLVIGYDRDRALRGLALPLVVGCLLQAAAWLVPNVFVAAVSGLLIVLTVAAAVRVLRRGPPGRPILRLDDRGVQIPQLGYTLPWTELAEVRLIPRHAAVRRDRGRPAVVVAFVTGDPEAALRELRVKGGGREFERARRVYGTPLAIDDQFKDEVADEIAATASAWAPVPVSRY